MYLGVIRLHLQEEVFDEMQHQELSVIGHGNLAMETPRCHRGEG
jgi:hypothetical protein